MACTQWRGAHPRQTEHLSSGMDVGPWSRQSKQAACCSPFRIRVSLHSLQNLSGPRPPDTSELNDICIVTSGAIGKIASIPHVWNTQIYKYIGLIDPIYTPLNSPLEPNAHCEKTNSQTPTCKQAGDKTEKLQVTKQKFLFL